MKKLLAIAAAAAAAGFLLAGCAASGTPSAASSPTTVTVSAEVTVTDISRTTRTVTQTATETVTVTPVPSTSAGPTTAPYVPPEGYTLFGAADSTTSYRFLNGDEFDCSETDDSCWGLSVHTQNGCSRGGSATLSVSVKDSDAGPVGEVSGNWAASAPNEAVPLVIGQVGLRPTADTKLTARLTSVTCLS